MPKKSFTGTCGKVVSLFLFAILSTTANALIITVEPDDYEPGADLTNVSPYVTLESITPAYPGSNVEGIHADDDGALGRDDYVAPTGNLTFGNHGFFVFGDAPDLGGFSMTFNQAVSGVSLLANSEYPPGLLAIWAAFDYDGNIIGTGSAGANVPLGEVFEINIDISDVWQIIVGGDDSTAAINFDHLVFEVADTVAVPEPGSLILFFSGLLLILFRQKAKRAIGINNSRIAA